MNERVKRLRNRLDLKRAYWQLDEHTIGVTFGSPKSYLRLSVMCRPYPDAGDAWGRDALLAAVAIDIGEFQGGFEITTFSHELARLRLLLSELERRLGQLAEASFRFLDDPRLHLSFRLLRVGHGGVEIDVDVRTKDYFDTILRFAVGGDGEALRAWIDALDLVLEVFPTELAMGPPPNPLSYP